MIKKRAQGWGFDAIIAMVIFTIGIMSFFLYSLNYNTSSDEILKLMDYDANLVSSSLLSEGYPINWDASNVVNIGITSEKKINETKLENLYNLSVSDYSRTKAILNTNYEYFFNFSEAIYINGVFVSGIGNKSINPKDLIKKTRFTIYRNKPVSLNLYIWK